jgi:hypothetical protein
MHDTLWIAQPLGLPHTSAEAGHAEPAAPPLPDPTQAWRYGWAYWRGTLGNLVRTHRLAAAAPTPVSTELRLSPALRLRWQVLFGVHEQERVPLLYTQGVGTLLYTQLFGALGFNFRHLVHLQHQTQHIAGAAVCASAPWQRLTVSVDSVTQAGSDRAIVALRSDIARGGDGDRAAPLARVIDRFLVRRLPHAAVTGLPVDPALRPLARGLSRRRPQLAAGVRGCWACSIALPADWGRRFAAVSGDANPVHTTAWGARLFGQPRAFAQGLSLRNAVAVRLARRGEPLDRLQISFASPAWLNQTLRLVVQDGRFELVGERGELVAFGETGAA